MSREWCKTTWPHKKAVRGIPPDLTFVVADATFSLPDRHRASSSGLSFLQKIAFPVSNRMLPLGYRGQRVLYPAQMRKVVVSHPGSCELTMHAK